MQLLHYVRCSFISHLRSLLSSSDGVEVLPYLYTRTHARTHIRLLLVRSIIRTHIVQLFSFTYLHFAATSFAHSGVNTVRITTVRLHRSRSTVG
jgi:hypothetical protein